MRHGEVDYFDRAGRPAGPDEVPLTPAGIEQARAAAAVLEGVRFDRVITSGLRRTVETAQIVAPASEVETWPDLRELRGGDLRAIADDELEDAFLRCFEGVAPRELRFLGGETVGALLDRVVPAVQRLVDDPSWDVALAVLHGGVNRAILSFALTGLPVFLGNFEQAPACLNVLDVGADGWVVRAVNVAPYDLAHLVGRARTMESLYEQYLPYRQRES